MLYLPVEYLTAVIWYKNFVTVFIFLTDLSLNEYFGVQ